MISRRLQLSVSVLVLSSAIAFAAGHENEPQLPDPLTDVSFLDNGTPDEAVFELDRNLFFDPILSGNQNISCGTCHDPSLGSGGGLALGIGDWQMEMINPSRCCAPDTSGSR